jgi:chromate reductase, NAD(P)H dehydrogenase (quinone)
MGEFTILGICGSLRKGSYNRMLLNAAKGLSPGGVTLDEVKIDELPLFNADLESNLPQSVKYLKAKIKAADAILFISPEYNYSIPGVLKNAIDWASRPYPDNSWAGKPVAIMGVSGGMLGTARMQYHLRQVFVFLDMHPVNKPEVMVGMAAQKFDKDGKLTDETARKLTAQLLENLVTWAKKIR